MKLNIKGPIIPNSYQWIYDYFEIDATSPKKISDLLEQANGEDIEADINSGGGSVFDASEIYTAIKSYKGKKTANIVGIAASAASVIGMAFDTLRMAPTGQMMIHNAATTAWGDYRDMDHTSEFLKNINQTIANAYNLKSGKSYEELLSMMDKETWLTPQQALEHNLIDEIMFGDTVQVVANVGSGLIPQEVIDKIRNDLLNNKFNNPVALNQITGTKEVNEVMDLEKLKNEHPELYKQVKNEGFQEGVTAENARFKAIDEIAHNVSSELVNKAKYEQPMTANELAFEHLKADAAKGVNFVNNREQELAPAAQVAAVTTTAQNSAESDEELFNKIANAANQKRSKGVTK